MQNAIDRRIVARPRWAAFAIRVSGSSKLRPVAAGHIAHYFVGRGDLVAAGILRVNGISKPCIVPISWPR
jgi:hypothetical protein